MGEDWQGRVELAYWRWCERYSGSFMEKQRLAVNARRAPFWRRLTALLYDALLVVACLMVVGFVMVAANAGERIAPRSPLFYVLQAEMLLTPLLFYVYFWTSQAQTLGMRAWRLVVMDENGQMLGVGRAMMRWGLAVLTCLPVGLGLWWALIDKQGRSLYDVLSKSRLFLVDKNPYS